MKQIGAERKPLLGGTPSGNALLWEAVQSFQSTRKPYQRQFHGLLECLRADFHALRLHINGYYWQKTKDAGYALACPADFAKPVEGEVLP